MTVAVINMDKKLIKIYDKDVNYYPDRETGVRVNLLKRQPSGAITIGGVKEVSEYSYGEPACFFSRKKMLDFLRKNKYYKLSDVKKDFIGYTVQAEGWRTIKTEKFIGTFGGFSVVDYREVSK